MATPLRRFFNMLSGKSYLFGPKKGRMKNKAFNQWWNALTPSQKSQMTEDESDRWLK